LRGANLELRHVLAPRRNGIGLVETGAERDRLPELLDVGLVDRAGERVGADLLIVGVDELLHGRDSIRGWGQDASVDQRLLFVTGFDPATQTFKYRVNQHFGAASGALNPFRIPFVLSLQARVSL